MTDYLAPNRKGVTDTKVKCQQGCAEKGTLAVLRRRCISSAIMENVMEGLKKMKNRTTK
jgi:hypothetical protein